MIELVELPNPDVTELSGSETLELTEGQKIRVQKRVGGDWVDVLDETVGAGKVWNVRVTLYIQQTHT